MDAALVGAGGVIIGTILSAVLGIWAEGRRSKEQAERDRQQRKHELDLRELELREEHRARLHAERRAAYAEFYRCYRLYDDAAQRWHAALREWGRKPDDAEAKAAHLSRFDLLARAWEPLRDALTAVELVASSPVATAASELRVAASALNPYLESDEDEDRDNQAARDAERYQLGLRELVLREAIRDELELDR